eukprot:scpid94126/ scgid30292/ 
MDWIKEASERLTRASARASSLPSVAEAEKSAPDVDYMCRPPLYSSKFGMAGTKETPGADQDQDSSALCSGYLSRRTTNPTLPIEREPKKARCAEKLDRLIGPGLDIFSNLLSHEQCDGYLKPPARPSRRWAARHMSRNPVKRICYSRWVLGRSYNAYRGEEDMRSQWQYAVRKSLYDITPEDPVTFSLLEESQSVKPLVQLWKALSRKPPRYFRVSRAERCSQASISPEHNTKVSTVQHTPTKEESLAFLLAVKQRFSRDPDCFESILWILLNLNVVGPNLTCSYYIDNLHKAADFLWPQQDLL